MTTGCTQKVSAIPTPASAGQALTFVDAAGREVSMAKPPQRIALVGRGYQLIADAAYLFPEAKTRIFALGKYGQGAANFLSMVDPQYEQKTKFETEVSAEQLAAIRPDAVILKSYLAGSLGQSLEVVGIPVVYVDFETPDQFFRDIEILGTLFQNAGRAEEILTYYRSRLDAITKKTSSLSEHQKPRVLLLYYSDKDGTIAFNVPPKSWMQSLLVEMAGGASVWHSANLGGGWTIVNFEQIAAWDADQIYIVSYFKPIDGVINQLKKDEKWQQLRAVKEGKLFGFAGDALSWDQADPRWILGLTWLASRLHPELFSAIDMKAEAQTFFQTLYGMKEDEFNQNMLPLLSGDIR